MAYCKKCGAYIPDGQENCLACGYDEAAERKERKGGASASAYAYSPKSDAEQARAEQARLRAEQRRREQQEMNRKWAESEQLRRRQQEDFRRSQEEAARRSAEYDAQRATNEDGYYRIRRNTAGSGASMNRGATVSDNKLFSYLSYLSFLCFLPSILGIQDPVTKFHAKQGRKLFFAGLILGWIPGLNAIAWLMQVVLAVIGIRNVSNGVMQELPIIGHIGEQ